MTMIKPQWKTVFARFPLLSVLALVLLTGWLGWSARQIETRYEPEDFFPAGVPERVVFDDYQNKFGRDDRGALIVLTLPHRTVVDLQTLRVIDALTERLLKRKEVEQVRSPTHVKLAIRDTNGVVKLERAFGPEHLKSNNTARLKEVLRQFKLRPYVNQIISADQNVLVVRALLRPEYMHNNARRAFTRHLEQEQQLLLKAIPGVRVSLAGYPIHRINLTEHINAESKRLGPFVLLGICLMLGLIFRRLHGVILPFCVASLSVVWTVGLMAFFGLAINIFAPALFVLIILVSMTDSIHFMSAYHELIKKGAARRQIPLLLLEQLFMPCLMTSLTTSIVFAGLTLTGIPLIAEFGLGVAFGVLSAFVITLLLAPPWFVLMTRFAPRSTKPPGPSKITRVLSRLDEAIATGPGRFLIVSILLIAGASAFASQVRVNSPLLADLDPAHPVQATNLMIERRLGGVIPLDIIVRPPLGADIKAYDAKRMGDIERLTERLRNMPEVLDATSPVDILHRMQPLLKRVPPKEVPTLMPAALLLAFEQVEPWVDEQSKTIRIRMRVKNLDTDKAMALFKRIEDITEIELGPDPQQKGILTGQGYLGQRINARLVGHFQESFAVGLLMVLLSIFIAFGHWRYPLLAILPNAFPLIMVLGMMGIAGMELRYTSALVLTVVFGLAVDDTIHTLAQLHANRGAKDPVEAATKHAGVGIIWTSLVLAVGFVTLGWSKFVPNQVLGILLALTAIAALWGDLVLLPALLRWQQRPRHNTLPKLQPVRVPVHGLDDPMRQQMFTLFCKHYDGVDEARFHNDLERKREVLLLRECYFGAMRGFCTLRVYDRDVGDQTHRVVFTGDTVVDQRFWGQKALQRGFSAFLNRVRLTTFGMPVYWLLTSKGYKTYLLLVNYFPASWPRYDQQTPNDIVALIDDAGQMLFGSNYHPEQGVAVLDRQLDRVKGGLANITPEQLQNAHITHFVHLNPGYEHGDELVCLAHIRWFEPIVLTVRVLQRVVRKFGT